MSIKELAVSIVEKIEDQEERDFHLKSLSDNATLNDQVMSFHRLYGSSIRHCVQPNLSDVPDEEVAMRVNLVVEEFREYLEAFGITYKLEFLQIEDVGEGLHEIVGASEHFPIQWVPTIRDKIDVVEIADASGDLKYVLEGADITFGIPSCKVSQEIHASNLTKLGEDGQPIYRFDGKILKGPSYEKPDIAQVIEENNAEIK